MDLSLINRLIPSYQFENNFTIAVGGVLVITMFSFIIYKIYSIKNNKNKYLILNENRSCHIEDHLPINNIISEQNEMIIETIDCDKNNLTFAKKTRYSEEDKLNLSNIEKLIEEAIFLDNINKKNEAINCIREALKIIELSNEKTHIQIILNKYILSTDINLEELVKEFFPLNKLVINNEFKNKKKTTEPIVFSIAEDFFNNIPQSIIKTNKNIKKSHLSLEENITTLVEQSKQIENEEEISNKEDNNKFLLAFGNIIDVKKDNKTYQ